MKQKSANIETGKPELSGISKIAKGLERRNMGFVMSIDTGNKMMKTNHFIFHSGIKRKEQKSFLEKKEFF